MGYADNPFAPVTEDELVVMNHLKTVLNRLSPDVQRTIFSSLLDEEIPRLTGWTSEFETEQEVPDSVHLIGLSKHPPVESTLELGSKSGGGPVDLYAEESGVGVAIEGKTKESLREGQLSRYTSALGADSETVVSWSDLYRALAEAKTDMEPYPAGLVDEFLDYLEQVGLHRPHQVAKYVWGDGEGVKQIRVEEEYDKLKITWKVKATAGQGKVDERVLSWSEFCDLFDDIEDRHGRDFIQRVFVDAQPPSQQPELDSDTVLGEIDPIREHVEDENYLRLNYHHDDQAMKLRTVRPSEGGTVGMPHNPGTDAYVWYTGKYELPELFEPQQELPGFAPAFREHLFLKRDYDEVKSHLW